MNKSTRSKKSIKSLLAIASIAAVLYSMPAYANNEAFLSGIEINSYDNNYYKIVLNTDKNIQVEKKVENNNKIILNLKNVKTARFVNTIYNNANSIDHVIVQPVSENQVRIFIEGENISASQIAMINEPQGNMTNQMVSGSYDEPLANNPSANVHKTSENPASTTPTLSSAPKTEIQAENQNINQTQAPEDVITLKNPIGGFKPFSEEKQTNQDELNSSSPFGIIEDAATSGVLAKKIFSTHNLDWILRFLTVSLLLAGAVKLFKPKDKNVKIDLSGDIKNREIDLYRSLNNNNKDAERRETPALGMKTTKPKVNVNLASTRPDYNNIQSRYGLQEYQNSQTPFATRNKPAVNKPVASPAYKNPSMSKTKPETTYGQLKAKTATTQANNLKPTTKTVNTISNSRITPNDMSTAKSNIDGVKFLESMAKIYEKTGRRDLAQGIHHNINRTGYSK